MAEFVTDETHWRYVLFWQVEQQWKREEASRLIDMANTRAGIGALLLQKNPELLKLLNDMR